MIDTVFIVNDSVCMYPDDTHAAAEFAVDCLMEDVISILRRKAKEHGDKGNRICALVVEDILKEFY